MPTGYTADIAKGITFKEYALHCARNFGALIMMRDDPADAPIPDEFKPSDYSFKGLDEAKKNLDALLKMTEDELLSAAENEYGEAIESYQKSLQEKANLKEKYQAMLEEAQAYVTPSPEHIEFKKFMIGQIETSIGFDCSTDYLSPPKRATARQFKQQQSERFIRDIEYHSKAIKEEMERTNSRNEWIRQLRESLKKY